MKRLDRDTIDRKLLDVPGWEFVDGAIRKTIKFGDFKEAIAFVNRVAEVAEEMNHHPEIAISYNKVTLANITHVAAGLTEHDFILARRINEI